VPGLDDIELFVVGILFFSKVHFYDISVAALPGYLANIPGFSGDIPGEKICKFFLKKNLLFQQDKMYRILFTKFITLEYI
jgi:hypothetical protein